MGLVTLCGSLALAELAAMFERQERTYQAEIHRHARGWEAELEQREQSCAAEIQRHARGWGEELERHKQGYAAELQRHASIREA